MISSRPSTSMRNREMPIYCHCNLQCSIYTCYKPNNRGRKFYRCPRKRSEDDCQFFRWVDEQNDLSQEMNQFTIANATEVRSNQAVSIRNDFFQIKRFLVILIFLVVVDLNMISRCCSCK
ncbi:hypothetical protein KFK09_003040 [Dendrobium nobile]|uniref:GRF-type domain-containing protein n=1 Tax=Dendrobium nobile TaxID=94219 RepID=A0A8T3C5L2_DENNO|nr:hypothetical protein KFK09_003040 [Dendrobium nobile]